MVDYFEIGQISNTHGLKGELKVRPFTESMKRFEELKTILVDLNEKLISYEIESVRYQKDVVLLKLKNVDSIEDAEKLKGHFIKIPRSEAKDTNDDEFFIADLIGLCVYHEGNLIGTVVDIFEAGASDVYVVKRNGKKDLLLPAIKSVIKKIDLKEERIDVEIPRGLDDEV